MTKPPIMVPDDRRLDNSALLRWADDGGRWIKENDGEGEAPPAHRGKLYRFMEAEHRLLDELLAQAAGLGGAIDQAAYETFRECLLRHIRIEERILLPMAQHKRGGEPLAIAPRLRLDHGTLAAVLMLPPAAQTFRALRAVLEAHNPLEENDGGVYEQFEGLAGSEADSLLEHAAATARIPVSRWIDSPKIVAAAKRALARGGYDPALLGPETKS
jgi:hemerythrin HHE cation binding domain-containing protein